MREIGGFWGDFRPNLNFLSPANQVAPPVRTEGTARFLGEIRSREISRWVKQKVRAAGLS